MFMKNSKRRQAGMTLMETLIALSLSLLVTSAMVALMSNSMGSTSKIILMSQLTDELRNTMSMMSRDVRRANYNPFSLRCYGNSDCGVGDSSVTFAGDLDVVDFSSNDCLRYFLERPAIGITAPGTLSGGGFRLVESGGIGRIEMWVEAGAPPDDCDGGTWTAVTDPDFVDITEFTVDDDTDEIIETVDEDGGTTLTMRSRQVHIVIEGELRKHPNIKRSIEDEIKVRNNFISSS